jgi:hypothetical protein
MITSMSNSRCRRIAIVIAAGIPNSTMIATAVRAIPDSQGWPSGMSSKEMSWQTTNATTTRTSHLTCRRSSRPPARYRTARDTNAAASNATDATNSSSSVPIGTSRSSCGKWARPNGFGKISEVPPGTGSCTSRGRRTRPAALSPASRKPAAASGRQRRDGSFPVGKSKTMNARRNATPVKLTSATAPACFAAGSAPGNTATPSTAYVEARVTKASPALSLSISQPIRLPARRTVSVPSVA